MDTVPPYPTGGCPHPSATAERNIGLPIHFEERVYEFERTP